MTSPCEIIEAQLPRLFSCASEDGHIRVRTPFLYPDGTVIDLFAKELPAGAGWTLSDLAETTRWLRVFAASARRSSKQTALLQDVAKAQRVEFFQGMLMLRVGRDDSLADAIVHLSMATIRIADLVFTYRLRSTEDLREDVSEYLTERDIPFERNKPFVGRSGRPWSVDFHTRTDAVSALMMVLSTGNTARAQQLVEKSFTTWSDLSHLRESTAPATKFISLVDDLSEAWKPEHFNLLSEISTPIMWSEPDALQMALSTP